MTDDRPQGSPSHEPEPEGEEALRARLAAADPAAELAAADPVRARQLIEDVMSTELTTESRETGTRHRSRLTWALAAAAVVAIAGAALISLWALADDEEEPGPADQASPSVTYLAVPAGAATGRCQVPTADGLAAADTAFAGTVTAIAGDDVTLEPTRWYAGEPTDEVVVRAPGEQEQRIESAVVFEEGERYLVSAVDGRLLLCGSSAAYDGALAALYAQAFD